MLCEFGRQFFWPDNLQKRNIITNCGMDLFFYFNILVYVSIERGIFFTSCVKSRRSEGRRERERDGETLILKEEGF